MPVPPPPLPRVFHVPPPPPRPTTEHGMIEQGVKNQEKNQINHDSQDKTRKNEIVEMKEREENVKQTMENKENNGIDSNKNQPNESNEKSKATQSSTLLKHQIIHAAVAKTLPTQCRMGNGIREKKISGNDENQPLKSIPAALQVLNEIVSTEQAYVMHLEAFTRMLMKPIVASAYDKTIEPNLNLKPEQVKNLFSNIDQLFAIAINFLEDIKSNSPVNESIDVRIAGFASVLDKYAPSFKMYTMYTANFNQSKTTLEELRSNSKYGEFQDFLDVASLSSACKGNNLESYLIMPVQRVPRYILLLKQLLLDMEKLDATVSNKQSIELLTNALKKLEDSASTINESIRSRENGEIIAKIQKELGGAIDLFSPGRSFVHRAKLKLLNEDWRSYSTERKSVEHEFFLFSDLVFYTTYTGFLSRNIEVNKVCLESNHTCHVVVDQCSHSSKKPLLQVGLPSNRAYALFGRPPIVLEFPNMELLEKWKKAIDEIILRRAQQIPTLLKREKQIPITSRNFLAGNANSYRMEGYLYKHKIGHGFGSFKKRWCVLENQVLTYYESKESFANNCESLGNFSMRFCYVDFSPDGKYEYPAIEIFSPDLNCTYVFGTETKRELIDWANYIKIIALKAMDTEPKQQGPDLQCAETHILSQRTNSTASSSIRGTSPIKSEACPEKLIQLPEKEPNPLKWSSGKETPVMDRSESVSSKPFGLAIATARAHLESSLAKSLPGSLRGKPTIN